MLFDLSPELYTMKGMQAGVHFQDEAVGASSFKALRIGELKMRKTAPPAIITTPLA